MENTRALSVRVNELELAKAMVYLESLGGDVNSLGRIVRSCVALVARIADGQNTTWQGTSEEAQAFLFQRYGQVGNSRTNQAFLKTVQPHQLHQSSQVYIAQRPNLAGQQSPQFCGIPESERIFRSPEEDAQFRDYCMLHKLKPFEDIQPEEWREKLEAQNKANMERDLEQQNERKALGSIPGNGEVGE